MDMAAVSPRMIAAAGRNPKARVFIRDHSKLGVVTYFFLNVLASHSTIPSVTKECDLELWVLNGNCCGKKSWSSAIEVVDCTDNEAANTIKV